MKATRREEELATKVAELDEANYRLLLDLEWERLSGQKLMAAMTQANKKTKKLSCRTYQTKKQGTAKGNGSKSLSTGPIPVDIFGNRMGTQGAALNSFIIPLIEAGKFEAINPANLATMSGGQFTKGRFADHLRWLRKKNLL